MLLRFKIAVLDILDFVTDPAAYSIEVFVMGLTIFFVFTSVGVAVYMIVYLWKNFVD